MLLVRLHGMRAIHVKGSENIFSISGYLLRYLVETQFELNYYVIKFLRLFKLLSTLDENLSVTSCDATSYECKNIFPVIRNF